MKSPKKHYTKDKTKVIRIRVSDDDYELWKDIAAGMGMSLSEYIRQSVQKGKINFFIRPKVPIPEISTLLAEFGKTGSNINQIAHWLNEGRHPDAAMKVLLEQAVKELNENSLELRKVVRRYGSS